VLVARAEVVREPVFELLVLEHVVFEGGGEVREIHPGFDAVLEANVFVEILRRSEVHEVTGRVDVAKAVDSAERWDDLDGIPSFDQQRMRQRSRAGRRGPRFPAASSQLGICPGSVPDRFECPGNTRHAGGVASYPSEASDETGSATPFP